MLYHDISKSMINHVASWSIMLNQNQNQYSTSRFCRFCPLRYWIQISPYPLYPRGPRRNPSGRRGCRRGDVDYAEHVAILVGFCGEIIVDDDAELCASVVRSLCGIGICYDPFRYEGRGIIPQRETYNNVGIATETVIPHFRIVQIAACVKRDETMFNHGSVISNPHRCEVKTGGETERTIVEHLRFLIAPRIEYSVVS